MWYETLSGQKPWTALWSHYILCNCGAIRTMNGECPVCQQAIAGLESRVYGSDGTEYHSLTVPGAEGRYEDYVYLTMLEREWLRPISDEDRFLSLAESTRPSPRAVAVLVFWTYFETRLERLLLAGMRGLPDSVTADLLNRYWAVGARLDRLYRILFSTNYWADLADLGYGHVAELLRLVQTRRNEFAHGHPEAIDELLVERVVAGLRDEHEGWIAVFNRCIARNRRCPAAPEESPLRERA